MPEAAWSFVFGQPSTAGWFIKFYRWGATVRSAASSNVVRHDGGATSDESQSWSKSGWLKNKRKSHVVVEICLKYVKSKDLKIMSKARMPHECEHPWNPCILECELDGTSHIVAAYCFLHSTFQKHCRKSSRKSRNTSNCPRRKKNPSNIIQPFHRWGH